jgi:molecular chaperone Hsp33
MDFLIRAMDSGRNFRVFAAVTSGVAEVARVRHDTWPVATAALGRAMTGALLLGANLKGDDMITLRIMGDGPLGAIVVSANARGGVRGYVQEPHVDLPRRVEGKLPVGEAVGRGMLSVTRDMGMKEPFTGSVEIISGEIAEDLTHYMAVSEQVPSALALGVLVDREGNVKASGGFLAEILPGADEEVVAGLEKNLAGLPPVSSMIMEGAGPEEIAGAVAGSFELMVLDRKEVAFQCSCGKKKVEGVLVSLGRDNIAGLMEERGGAEVRCHFCGEVYQYSRDELESLLAEMG